MADPCVAKLAEVRVNYSLELKPGEKFWLRTTRLADELNFAVYEEAIRAGARTLGEWGIGTNYGIQRFSKNMLFDEKIGGKNESGLHWDMAESEITLDGDPFYRNGKTVI